MDELLKLLESVNNSITKGHITEVSAAGVRTVRGPADISQLRMVRRDIKYSLYLRAAGTAESAKYPDPWANRIRRTRTRYTFS